MKSEHFHHVHDDGSSHFVYRWLPAGEPRALVQIVHGMAEHAGRYEALARALCADGLAVIAQDLPGHGRTAQAGGARGHFADRDGWAHALAVIRGLRRRLAAEHPDLPQVLFGHSMGSFLAQHLLADDPPWDGVVLSATTADLGPMRGLGAVLMDALGWAFGRRHLSALGEQMSFKAFNKAFAPNRTAFDWLSRDDREVDAYVADPDCGHRCTVGLWQDLLTAGAALNRLAAQPPAGAEPALWLIAGSADPVSQGERGPRQLAEAYRRAGRQRVDERYYAEARHELLHETCRDEVIADLRQWLGNLLGSPRS